MSPTQLVFLLSLIAPGVATHKLSNKTLPPLDVDTAPADGVPVMVEGGVRLVAVEQAIAEALDRMKRLETRQGAFESVTRWLSEDRVETRLGNLERVDTTRQSDLEDASRRIAAIDHSVDRVRDAVSELTGNVHGVVSHVRDLEEKESYLDLTSISQRLEVLERLVPETRMRRIEMRADETASAVAEATDRWSVVKERVNRLEQHLVGTVREIVDLRWSTHRSEDEKNYWAEKDKDAKDAKDTKDAKDGTDAKDAKDATDEGEGEERLVNA
jgi:hypothetical protein